MAITKVSGRQEVINATAIFAYSDLTSGTAVPAIDLPPNARILNITLRIKTAFDSGTTDALIVQSNEGTPKAYITISAASGSLAALKVWTTTPVIAGTTSTYVGFLNPDKSTIDVKWTSVGTAADTGLAILMVQYVIEDRERFSQG